MGECLKLDRKRKRVCLSSEIPIEFSRLYNYVPGIGTLAYTVSSPLGRIQHLRTLLQLQPIITI